MLLFLYKRDSKEHRLVYATTSPHSLSPSPLPNFQFAYPYPIPSLSPVPVSTLNTVRQTPTTAPLPATNRLGFDRPLSSTQPQAIPRVAGVEIAFPEHVAEGGTEGGGIPSYFIVR